jgi:hypothetical protein
MPVAPGLPARTSGLEEFEGTQWYTVADVDRLEPFLMSVVSDGDRWMFVSSNGALTAGRGDATQALFPYVTDDRLHASAGRAGPATRLRVQCAGSDGPGVLWVPGEPRPAEGTRRFVSKSVVGDSVAFEEHRSDLGVVIRTRWSTSAQFGFVRTATLVNVANEPVRVHVLDGLLDVVPYGLDPTLYQRLSNLANAYKRSELVGDRLAVYSLETPVSDQAEPEEVLRATVVWSAGLDGFVHLDERAIERFEAGDDDPSTSSLVTGRPGAYLLRGDVELTPGRSATWHIVADVGRTQSDVVALRDRLRATATGTMSAVIDRTRETAQRLTEIMALADASQLTGDAVSCAHHVANVTYNVMRGGVPLDGYLIDVADLIEFVGDHNRDVGRRHAAFLASLPEHVERRDLLAEVASIVEQTGDVHLARLVESYLPFSFSRRHGDPSRPWNRFSIRVVDDAGAPVVYYEGNWRDLFQNWEALCASFPEYLPAVVAIFVNASTADGYNPYRVTRDGIDWEVPDPEDPWSNIGYWGDHQIVYLLRLLEASEQYLPGEIAQRLDRRAHTYADVPYRIASYDELVADPKSTIEFDEASHVVAEQRTELLGADGKLLARPDGDLVVVTLLEKLLVAALAKLSNFVPGGGIWMNTQRPEWNDANNALVGNGLSMVTLFHLRRYLTHLRSLVDEQGRGASISVEVVSWFDTVREVLVDTPVAATNGDADRHRRDLMDRLGRSASNHRERLYGSGLSGTTETIGAGSVVEFCEAAVAHLDETIRTSIRPDGLVHSYNILHRPSHDTASVSALPEMLEGQVAALASAGWSAREHADLLDALFASALHRADLDTFLLAPPRQPPSFLEKNVIDPALAGSNPLLAALLGDADRSVIRTDPDGTCRFAPDLTTAPALRARLERLADDERWAPLVAGELDAVLEVYDSVFGHRAYIGRSGSMYAYEGIGSVYWHMVTKLLLAVQEALADAVRRGDDAEDVERLRASYWRIHAGLGVNKSAEEFGAIPTDPYSHTPSHAGAQQPGMTGAVKEEILTRRRELGIAVVDGLVEFDDLLIRERELLSEPTAWTVDSVDPTTSATVAVPARSVASTICQVPVVVTLGGDHDVVEVEHADGRTDRRAGRRLSAGDSAAIFGRTGDVTQVRVTLS